MEYLWLKYAKRLHALASSGATYTKDRYDQERYQEIAHIALQMMADLGKVPVTTIEGLVGPYACGYVTPKVDVRGAVFSEGRILLVRKKRMAFGPCRAALPMLASRPRKTSSRRSGRKRA